MSYTNSIGPKHKREIARPVYLFVRSIFCKCIDHRSMTSLDETVQLRVVSGNVNVLDVVAVQQDLCETEVFRSAIQDNSLR
jgi:hypothetical protein